MSDLSFEKILAEHNKAYAEAEVFSSWMPPEGEYIVVVSNTKRGTTIDDAGNEQPWWRITGKIQEPANPDLDQAEFAVGFYRSSAYGILKGAAAVLAGKPVVANLREADEIVMGSKGKVLKVRVEMVESKKYTGPRCSILQVIEVQEVTA